jgi:hypothetical protein
VSAPQGEAVARLREALRQRKAAPTTGEFDYWTGEVFKAAIEVAEAAPQPQPQAEPAPEGCGPGCPANYMTLDGGLCCNKYGIRCKAAPQPQAAPPVESFPMPLQDWVASLPIPGVVTLDTSDHGDGLWRLRNHSPRFLFVLEGGDRIKIVGPKGGAYLFEGAHIFAVTGPIQTDDLLALCSRRFK